MPLKFDVDCFSQKLLSKKSKEKFGTAVKNSNDQEARNIYFRVLSKMEEAVISNDIECLKNLNWALDNISCMKDAVTLQKYYIEFNDSHKNQNLVILTCKHQKEKVLEYLFSTDCQILINLSKIGNNVIQPDDTDQYGHNAFYYSVRSSNTELLDILINKWPDAYFKGKTEQLDELLSSAYKELKLKRVLLSDAMQNFVENKLVDFRFFSDGRIVKNQNLDTVKERVKLMTENVRLIELEYTTQDIDERFVVILQYVAQNIFILKQQLKSTYDKLPWEEMEFCLIAFVSSHIEQQELNLIYKATLNKKKIIMYLKVFVNVLNEVVEKGHIQKWSNFPNLQRKEAIAAIVSNNPFFENLCTDYKLVRDIQSLETVRNYVNLMLSSDHTKKEGQLVIIRTLQVLGENLKDTLMSPKMSPETSEHLLTFFPQNTRDIITTLRNSLSHSSSLSKILEVESNTVSDFFSNLKNDSKKLGLAITENLIRKKINVIKKLLETILKSDNFSEIQSIFETLTVDEFDDQEILKHLSTRELEGVEQLVKNISDIIIEKTAFEKQLFSTISKAIDSEKNKIFKIETDYTVGRRNFLLWMKKIRQCRIDDNSIRGIKFHTRNTLEYLNSNVEQKTLKSIAEDTASIVENAASRMDGEKINKMRKSTYDILCIVEFEMGNMKWIEDLKDKFHSAKCKAIPNRKIKQEVSDAKVKQTDELKLKLSELENILSSSDLKMHIFDEKFSDLYSCNKNLHAAIEMLCLDVLSILSESHNCLSDNLLSLDHKLPILVGKNLRNHLAHGNALLQILDCSVSVIANAKKFTTEHIADCSRNIGKQFSLDIAELKARYAQELQVLDIQKQMFHASAMGSFEDFLNSLEKGADIYARSLNLWSTLHFAAKGSNLEIVAYLIDQHVDIDAKDMNGQSPLHIAVTFGQIDTVQYLVEKRKMDVNCTDKSGKTPLHIAAQRGDVTIIRALLKNKASVTIRDAELNLPLHYAISNNHKDAAQILLDLGGIGDVAGGGFKPLHVASENGHLEIVDLLLKYKVDTNAITDQQTTPLHLAALNGHLKVVVTLISNGSNVNAKTIDGGTPLCHAVETGRGKVVEVLLKHGADVDAVDCLNYTPLHFAAEDGYLHIVEMLLEKKANVDCTTYEGWTPLNLAAKNGHLDTVKALTNRMSIKSIKCSTALHISCFYGHAHVVRFLLDKGGNVNFTEDSQTPLHAAALRGDCEVMKVLIAGGANVNSRDASLCTPLYLSADQGHYEAVKLLMENGAQINVQNMFQESALGSAVWKGNKGIAELLIVKGADLNERPISLMHKAALSGNAEIVNILIKRNISVNSRCYSNTPLHLAVESNHWNVVKILIENGADLDAKNDHNLTPLCIAVKNNYKEMTDLLIESRANVNEGRPLGLAVFYGYTAIVQSLLRNPYCKVYQSADNDETLLHLAAARGHRNIVEALLAKGFSVHMTTSSNATALHLAAERGHNDIVEILISHKAKVNARCSEGLTALHIAAVAGHLNIVQMLITSGANPKITDFKNRTSIELAVAHGKLKVVEFLLHLEAVNVNDKNLESLTLLHIAAQMGNLDIVQCLINSGADVHARNDLGTKPIHIAAREGHVDCVELFLKGKQNIDDLGMNGQNLMHYAAMEGHVDVAKCLINKKINLDASDENGVKPICIAAAYGHEAFLNLLLGHGAQFNSNCLNESLLSIAQRGEYKGIVKILQSTEKLFKAVKSQNNSQIEACIKAGGHVNAKSKDNISALHYASWKGYENVVDILLTNQANPNNIGKSGCSPLHYASKFNQLAIVKTLLLNGAIYNIPCENQKTPLDFATNPAVKKLLQLIHESFISIKNGNSNVIDKLKTIKDSDTMKVVMNAHDMENRTLLIAAVHFDFPRTKYLRQLFKDDSHKLIHEASELSYQEKYEECLVILRKVLEKRRHNLGDDHPDTLELQYSIGKVLYKQNNYDESLSALQELCQKQVEIYGNNNADTLKTRESIALIFFRQKKYNEALVIFEEVLSKQKSLLGSNHLDVLNTQCDLALALDALGKYEEALNINYDSLKSYKKLYGNKHPHTLKVKNNIGAVLHNQEKFEEALEIFTEVHEDRKKILGANHSDTLRTAFRKASAAACKDSGQSELMKKVLNTQKTFLGSEHLDTLITQQQIANMLLTEGKIFEARKIYQEILIPIKIALGQNHPNVLETQKILEGIDFALNISHTDVSVDKSDNTPNNCNFNKRDPEGRTALHFAVNDGQKDVVEGLLNNGADPLLVSNKGNTALHIAAFKGNSVLAELLLAHVREKYCYKFFDFVNAKTTVAGSTALHVAANKDTAVILLKYGANYCIQNKRGQRPIDFCKILDVKRFLSLIDEVFKCSQGSDEMKAKLQYLAKEELDAITMARNDQGFNLYENALNGNNADVVNVIKDLITLS